MGIYFLLLSQFRDSFYNKPVMFIWLYVQANGDEDNSNLALGHYFGIFPGGKIPDVIIFPGA